MERAAYEQTTEQTVDKCFVVAFMCEDKEFRSHYTDEKTGQTVVGPVRGTVTAGPHYVFEVPCPDAAEDAATRLALFHNQKKYELEE